MSVGAMLGAAAELKDAKTRYEKARGVARKHARALIAELTRDVSLRSLAIEVGLSVTYLSLVYNEKTPISEDVYLRLAAMLKRKGRVV